MHVLVYSKKRFRVTKVDSLDDIAKVVVSSAQVNEVQLVGTQSGEIIVQTYDWAGFFGSLIKKIPLITKHHHFKFYSTHPGTVTVKEYSDSHENVYVLTHLCTLIGLPEIFHPRGLSLERQWYLHDKIREFCSPETRDLVCPEPHTPKPRSSSAPPSPQPSLHQLESENDPSPPPIKKRRVCGSCGQFGHNKRTCPQ